MKFYLETIAPFNFELTAGFFSYDDEEIRIFNNGIFQQVLPLKNKQVLTKLRSCGSVERPKLICELSSNEKLNSRDKSSIEKQINSIFNLDLDLNRFYKEIKNDDILSTVVSELRGLKGPNNTTIFEGLVCSIIEQQISLKVAFSIQKRFIKTFGRILNLNGKKYFAFPEPEDVYDQQIEKFRSCGLSERKAEYIRGIAELIVNNDLELEKFRKYLDPQSVIDELTKIRGIGTWTVELTMLRSMGRFDIVPADDLGLKRYISNHYFNGEKISTNDVRRIAESWGSWKGLAAYYLLEADRLGLNGE